MSDLDSTAYSPPPQTHASPSPGELLGRALETRPITGNPHGWEPPTPKALEIQLPAYEVQAFLARGGMGAVYRGVQTSLGRQVAIKILPSELRDSDPHYAARFKQEARAMAQLNHPAIVSVYDFGEMPDGTFYFIMEFIDGTDVGQMVAQQGRLASAHAMAITAHVCDALQYAHERGIMHRDIKPANIMVGFDGRVKVADFGLAKSIRQADTGLTQSGYVMGTPHFVAPEAMIMGVSVDHRADIYAVGVMLYQMLTGRVPQGLFEMPSHQVPGLDPRYDAIVSSAMRENRDLRYQHIIDMRRALDAIVTQPVVKSEAAPQTLSPTLASRPSKPQRLTAQPNRPSQRQPPQPAPKKKSYTRWLAVGGVVVAFCGYFLWPQQEPVKTANTKSTPEPAKTPTAGISPSVTDKEPTFVNSIGMKFVPVPGTSVLFCTHETRNKDYAAYAAEMPSVDAKWKHPVFEVWKESRTLQDDNDHPVAFVSWEDAKAFCSWLSRKEGRTYRLPTDHEWSCAVGIGDQENTRDTPKEKDRKASGYPWGNSYPPPADNVGNYWDEASSKTFTSSYTDLIGYRDGHVLTAPVMSYPANKFGIYDLGGNVWEWCEDLSAPEFRHNAKGKQFYVLRGASWYVNDRNYYASSVRFDGRPADREMDQGFRCVLEVVPSEPPKTSSSPAPSPRTLSRTVDVKLEFKNAEKYYDVGGYQPNEVPLSTKVPRSVSNAPTGLISPLYGELKLGPPSSQRNHAIILSNPKTENARLFVDGNANGDLTDDPPAQWKPGQKSNLVTGEKWDAFEGDFSVELSFSDGTHRARFEVFADNSNGNIFDSLLIHPQYGRVGSVNLNGKNYKALLYDDGSKGDFSAPSSTFRLDLAGGSGFRWEEAEAFPVNEFFTVDGMTYQLAGLTPSGDAFKIVPTPSWIGQTAPTLSTTTITGDKISLPGGYKGKIVLMHFWSIGQKLGLDDLPQLKAAYEKHHSASFDMLGICVEYRRGKDMLPTFVKDNNILWPQVCEHQSGARDHPVLKLFKTHSVPSSFLIDGDTGGILACGERGGAMEAAIDKAVAEKKRTPSQVIPTKSSPLNLSPSATTAEVHSFTNTKGQSIRAALVKISGDDIVLRKEDGIDYTVKAAALSATDIEWLKTKGLVITETEMPKPVAVTPAPPASVPSTPPAPVLVIPEESKTSTLQHTMIFGLSKADAASILPSSLLKSNPKAVLETVQGMVTGKRATLVSNLSVSSKFGNRSRVEAAYGCESEVTVKADGTLNAMFAITSIQSPASPKLVGDVATKRGDTVFLGSFDESEAVPKMPIRIVFITFQ